MTQKPQTAMKPKRTRTATVSYPYHPLALCLDVAKAVREIGNGKTEVSRSLLASHLGIDEKSADFAQKLASSKCYGLIEGRSAFKLTDLAMGIFFPTEDPEREKRIALLEAVGTPGAFAALLERYDGSRPQPQEVLGNILGREMGLPESWKMRIASFFIRSLEMAGAISPDGYIRHKAELEKLRSSSGPSSPGFRTKDTNERRENGRSDAGQDDLDGDDDVLVWLYPFHGRKLRIETPATITKDVWNKINRYLQALDPEPDSNP
jgi:hypothetical protein